MIFAARTNHQQTFNQLIKKLQTRSFSLSSLLIGWAKIK
jgi:hypothetical protein